MPQRLERKREMDSDLTKITCVPVITKGEYTLIDYGKYYIRVFENNDGWTISRVEIYDRSGKIGEYERNYSQLNTFVPFTKNGKDYALYSPRYTCTRVMSLPSCKDIGGEEPNSGGFCPVSYFVPVSEFLGKFLDEQKQKYKVVWPDGNDGFVMGCVWGDDCSWKLQHLDLSRVEEGIVNRTNKLGYWVTPAAKYKMNEYIRYDDCALEDDGKYFMIAKEMVFNLETGEIGDL